jgi:hypothetical protein
MLFTVRTIRNTQIHRVDECMNYRVKRRGTYSYRCSLGRDVCFSCCVSEGVMWAWHLNDKWSALVNTSQRFIDLVPGKMLEFQLKSVFLARFITANVE